MNKYFPTKLFLSVALLLALGLSSLHQVQALNNIRPTPEIPTSAPSSDISLYLPLIGKSYPAPPTVYGVETVNFAQWKLDRITQANVSWVRNAAFSWAEIEPAEPGPGHTYHWEVVDEAGLIDAANRSNLTTIAIIRETPVWARMSKYSNYVCGPVDSTDLDNYATFVNQLVLRYSAAPYNIKYYEFGNEPDVDPALFGTWYNPPFGCWGDASDTYYGGRYYAEMLKHIYPAVKAADPQSNVIIGGLLLNCDPTHPPPTPPHERCLPSKFLEGILRNQGAANFDILAFHGYPSYYQGKILDETHPNFAYRGGQLVGKVDFLRSVMAQFVVNKPILMTEVAFKCQTDNECGNPPSNNFLQLQADFVVQAYVRSWGLNLKGAIWYKLDGTDWYQTGLFDGTTARPAYNALVFMSTELKEATIGAQLIQFTGLRGYEFIVANKRVWVLWSPDGVTGKSISLPANVTMIYDKYGTPITPTNPITIVHPTYFEFPR